MVDAKYRTLTMRENRKQDDFMCFELARMLGLPVRSIPLVLEGGNFISNGDGLLIDLGQNNKRKSRRRNTPTNN
jgi:agmatine/peptidylarginine deiminase